MSILKIAYKESSIVEDFLAGRRHVSNPAVTWERSISLQNTGADKDAVSLYAGKKEDKKGLTNNTWMLKNEISNCWMPRDEACTANRE